MTGSSSSLQLGAPSGGRPDGARAVDADHGEKYLRAMPHRRDRTTQDPVVFARLVERWRAMSTIERMEQTVQLGRDVEILAIAGIRSAHPGYDDRNVARELVRRRYGAKLGPAAYPDPPSIGSLRRSQPVPRGGSSTPAPSGFKPEGRRAEAPAALQSHSHVACHEIESIPSIGKWRWGEDPSGCRCLSTPVMVGWRSG